MPTYNLISIDTVTFETALARYEKDFGSEVFLKTASEGDDPGYRVITEEKPTNRFASMEQFEVYTDYVNMLYEMRELEFDIHENNLPVIGILPFVLSDLMLLDHNGTLVIGDTLFVIDSVKTVLKSLDGEVIKEVFHDEDGTQTSMSKERIPQVPSISDVVDQRVIGPFVWYDINSDLWKIQVVIRNTSHGGVVKRSSAVTGYEFRRPSGNWHVPHNASTLFPNFESHVTMYTRFKKGFGPCRNRTRGASGTFKAEVVKPRCADNGVTSDHYALQNGMSLGTGTPQNPLFLQ